MYKFSLFILVLIIAIVFIPFSAIGASLGTLLIFGTFWFWGFAAVVTVVAVCLLWNMEDDIPSHEDYSANLGATGFFLLIFLALQFMSDIKPFTFIWTNPTAAIVCVLAYGAIGAGWSLIKWWNYLREKARKYKTLRAEWESSKSVNGTPASSWDRYLQNHSFNIRFIDGKPIIDNHKSLFMHWIMYWPYSLVWTLISDPITKMVKAIYEALSGVYTRMAEKAFGDIVNHF